MHSRVPDADSALQDAAPQTLVFCYISDYTCMSSLSIRFIGAPLHFGVELDELVLHERILIGDAVTLNWLVHNFSFVGKGINTT